MYLFIIEFFYTQSNKIFNNLIFEKIKINMNFLKYNKNILGTSFNI